MNPKLVLFYILFSMAAFIFFVFLLFPGKKVAAYLSGAVTKPDAMVQVTMDDAELYPPLRLTLDKIRFTLPPDIIIKPTSFAVSLSPVVFFENEKTISFQSKLFQGTIHGSLKFTHLDPLTASAAHIIFSDIKTASFIYKTTLADITLSSEISGEYIFSGQENEKKQGQGTIFFRNVSAVMENSLFNRLNLPAVDFSLVEAGYEQTGNTLTITNCIAKGSIVHIKLTGDIHLGFPLKESRLDLTGRVLPESPYLAAFANNAAIRSAAKNISKDGIKFGISGTVMQPKIEI